MSVVSERLAPVVQAEPGSLLPARRGRHDRLSLPLWLVLLIGTVYFLVPLAATIRFSVDTGRGISLSFYQTVLKDPGFFQSIELSLLLSLLTVVVSIVLIFPTAYWVNLRLSGFRPVMTFLTLLPFVIPPVIFALGLVQAWSNSPVPLFGTEIFLVCAYVVLSFPYMYAAVDNGLRAMDIHTLTEAAQSLGAPIHVTLLRVILPNLWPALVSGALLSFSIVMGEFVLASLLHYNTFPIYLNQLGQAEPQQAAAVTIISFAITWFSLGIIQALSRRAPGAAPAAAK